jgi:hypothetical protein
VGAREQGEHAGPPLRKSTQVGDLEKGGQAGPSRQNDREFLWVIFGVFPKI